MKCIVSQNHNAGKWNWSGQECMLDGHKTHLTHTSLDLEFLNGSIQITQRSSSSSEEESSAFTLSLAGFFAFLVLIFSLSKIFFLMFFPFRRSSSSNASFTGVSVRISERLFFLPLPVSFLGPAFGNGLISDGLNDWPEVLGISPDLERYLEAG